MPVTPDGVFIPPINSIRSMGIIHTMKVSVFELILIDYTHIVGFFC